MSGHKDSENDKNKEMNRRESDHGPQPETVSTSSSRQRGSETSVIGSNTSQRNDQLPPIGFQGTRQFAILPHHRRKLRERYSAQDAFVQQPGIHGNDKLRLPRQKSFSVDAIGANQRQTGLESPNGNANNGIFVGASSRFFKGTLFRTYKVAPGLNTSPALCLTDSHQFQTQGLCSKRSSKMGESVCINVNMIKSCDSMDNICRICHDSPSSEKLIKPCLCKGSMGCVHRTCLERWLGESGKGSCEICGQEFNTVRVPRYRGIRSFLAWIKHPVNPTDTRNFFFDLACFFILTPLALLSGWLCIVGAQTYAADQEKSYQLRNLNLLKNHQHETLSMRANRDVSNSTWTSIGLLSLTGTLVAAYIIWIFVAFRYHLQVWREWQQRNYIVTIVPLANGEFCYPPAPRPPSEQNNASPDANGNANDRGRGLERGRYIRSDESLNESPTTRFIREMFIPSLMNDPDQPNNNPAENHRQHADDTALQSVDSDENYLVQILQDGDEGESKERVAEAKSDIMAFEDSSVTVTVNPKNDEIQIDLNIIEPQNENGNDASSSTKKSVVENSMGNVT